MHMTVAFDGPVVLETRLEGLRLKARGKVRDIYELGESLLIVATDRISAFDVVLPDGIPGKGAVLTQLSAFWFRWLSQFEDILWNHFISAASAEMKWFQRMSSYWESHRNQKAESWVRTAPLPGMPSGSTTSNAEMRSVATISSDSPSS